MKFSTETIAEITRLMVTEFERQIREGTKADFSEMEQEMRQVLKEIGKKSLGQMLDLQDEKEHGRKKGCECKGKAKRISRRAAKLMSVFGWIEYRRSYYHCASCGRRWYELDKQQRLRPGRATQGMTRLLGIAGVTVSFEEASRQIAEYLLVEVSVNTIRCETQELGIHQQKREAEWIRASQDLNELQTRERDRDRQGRIYGSMDGAFVPIGSSWKELKTISWYQARKRYGSEEMRAENIHYYTGLDDAESFGKLVWASAVHHQIDWADELIFVCDGAVWIWKLISHYFPKAVQIVDWYHASKYLYPIADALFGAESSDGAEWIVETQDLLWKGQVSTVIQVLEQLILDGRGGPPVHDALTYYTNNQNRMDYAAFREQGFFIGSGTVESACKQIASMRLKRSGAQWSMTGASATAKARAAWLSHQWDDLLALPLAV
jgi:hypothetical protein